MTASSNDRMRSDMPHPSRTLALATGVLFTVIGLLGFAVTGFDDFVGKDTQETLLGFELNGLHNVVHLAIGLMGLLLWRRLDTARTFGWLLFAGYGATFLYGLWAVGNTEGNILSINGADNGLHLFSALLGLAIALWPTRDRHITGTGHTDMERGRTRVDQT